MQLVPKPNSKNMYCNACKDKYEDYLEVTSILFSIFSQINIKRKFKIIFLMIIFSNCRINTKIVGQRWNSKKNKSHSLQRPLMWLWLTNLPKLNSCPGQPKRWNIKKLVKKKTPIRKTRTLLRKGIKIRRNITSSMINCSIDSETHTGTCFNWIVKIFTIVKVCQIHIYLIQTSSTTTLFRTWSYVLFHMCCSTMLITTSVWGSEWTRTWQKTVLSKKNWG